MQIDRTMGAVSLLRREVTWNLKISGDEKEVIFLRFLSSSHSSSHSNHHWWTIWRHQGFPNPLNLCKKPGFSGTKYVQKIQKEWSQPKPSFTTITGISLEKIFWVPLMTNEAQLLPVMKPQEPFVWGTKREERFTGTGTIGGAFKYFLYFHPDPWGRWPHFDEFFQKGFKPPN